jgi:hypothetical protein
LPPRGHTTLAPAWGVDTSAGILSIDRAGLSTYKEMTMHQKILSLVFLFGLLPLPVGADISLQNAMPNPNNMANKLYEDGTYQVDNG